MSELAQAVLGANLLGLGIGFWCGWIMLKRRARVVIGKEVSDSISEIAAKERKKGPVWTQRPFWLPPGVNFGSVRIDAEGKIYNDH